MKKAISFFIAFFFLFVSPAFAEEATTTPETATSTPPTELSLDIHTGVDVPADCSTTDTDGVAHSYVAVSTDAYLAICALVAAEEAGAVFDVGLSNAFPDFGLFLTSLNGIVADSNSQYWALYKNGDFASFGLTGLPVATGDTVTLELHDFSDTFLGARVSLTVASLIATTSDAAPLPAPSGGGGGGQEEFDVPAALAYLSERQEADGSFGSPLLSDWAALALSAANANTPKTLLREHLLTLSSDLSSVTDYERHAMALMALDSNPYTAGGISSIEPIVNAFDGTQIGESDLDNDDIFALFPLLRAGYNTNDLLIQKTVSFILTRQGTDGAWDASVDITAAAIQALVLVEELPGVPQALLSAESYLRGAQNTDGGFGAPGESNSFSTSWVLQAISALHHSPYEWSRDGHTPEIYLTKMQESDGGVGSPSETEKTRVWATLYALPAALGKPWASLMKSFPRPKESPQKSRRTSSDVLGTATTTVATTSVAAVIPVSMTVTVVPPALPVTKSLIITPSLETALTPVEVSAPLPRGFFDLLRATITSLIAFIFGLL